MDTLGWNNCGFSKELLEPTKCYIGELDWEPMVVHHHNPRQTYVSSNPPEVVKVHHIVTGML